MSPEYGSDLKEGKARTDKNLKLDYDLIFWAVGSQPNTDYFPSNKLSKEGRIPVDQYLRVKHIETVKISWLLRLIKAKDMLVGLYRKKIGLSVKIKSLKNRLKALYYFFCRASAKVEIICSWVGSSR